MIKYGNSADMMVAGDLNASLTRDKPTKRDKLVLDFMEECNLHVPTNLPVIDTYHHHHGHCNSQIYYYFLLLLQKYQTHQRDAPNTSTHDPISISFKIHTSSSGIKAQHTSKRRIL